MLHYEVLKRFSSPHYWDVNNKIRQKAKLGASHPLHSSEISNMKSALLREQAEGKQYIQNAQACMQVSMK